MTLIFKTRDEIENYAKEIWSKENITLDYFLGKPVLYSKTEMSVCIEVKKESEKVYFVLQNGIKINIKAAKIIAYSPFSKKEQIIFANKLFENKF